ncbi:MAG TPA: hypothetical protein VHY08_02545, partial [Bacillota bacterium]|nr:hypothetical protein [Bacillota bacterium]
MKINSRILGNGLWVGVLGLFLLMGGFGGPLAVADQLAGAESPAGVQSPVAAEQSTGVESLESPAVAETIKFENPEIKLEANQITMDSAQKLIEARGQVRLLVKQSEIRFETEELNYDLEMKVVKIPGQVRIISETADLLVDTLTYDVKTLEGQGGALEGTLAETPRAVAVEGQQFETAASKEITISGAALTRCPKTKPDYLFKSGQMTITKERVSLTHIVLYFKGIPIFYLPYFSFKIKEKSNFPGIEGRLKYDYEQKALGLDYDISIPINDQSDFLVKGSLIKGEDSNTGIGYGFRIGDLTNRSYLIKYFQKDWVFEDRLNFGIGGVNTTLTATHDFGTQENSANLLLTKDFETLL